MNKWISYELEFKPDNSLVRNELFSLDLEVVAWTKDTMTIADSVLLGERNAIEALGDKTLHGNLEALCNLLDDASDSNWAYFIHAGANDGLTVDLFKDEDCIASGPVLYWEE